MARGRGRGRPRSRVSRMDAAVDAMLPYGFAETRVTNQVRELLEVYGGDQGWPFIEECAYKVLIDSLLENGDDEEEVVQDGDPLALENEEDGEAGPPAIMEPPRAEPNSPLPEPAKRMRFPCYGWIESDEDDDGDDEFICLSPASTAMGAAGQLDLDSAKWTTRQNLAPSI